MIHVAITRKVRPGREAEFEAKLHDFFHQADTFPGTSGAYLLRPLPGATREYGILRAFEDEHAKASFYTSRLYRQWDETVRDLVDGAAERHELHGLEAFFRSDGALTPPTWKMAILTFIAVNPAVYVCANGVPALFGKLPPLAELLLVNSGVVTLLTWVIMPVLVRVARPWLRSPESETRSPQPHSARRRPLRSLE